MKKKVNFSKVILYFCEQEIRSRYPFLENQEQRKLIKEVHHEIVTELVSKKKKLTETVYLWDQTNNTKNNVKDRVMDRLANWFMKKYRKSGILGQIFGLGRGLPFKVVSDPNLSPSKSVMAHALPDFKGSLKLSKVIKHFLTKDQYGNYEVDPYIKEKFGSNSDVYKKLQQIADDKNTLDNDIPDDFRMDKYNIKAAMRQNANDVETNLFLKHRQELENDPVLAKKFGKLRSKLLNSGEDVVPYLRVVGEKAHDFSRGSMSTFNPLKNKPYALDRKYAAGNPTLQGLFDVLSSRKTTSTDKSTALRLIKKELRRIKKN